MLFLPSDYAWNMIRDGLFRQPYFPRITALCMIRDALHSSSRIIARCMIRDVLDLFPRIMALCMIRDVSYIFSSNHGTMHDSRCFLHFFLESWHYAWFEMFTTFFFPSNHGTVHDSSCFPHFSSDHVTMHDSRWPYQATILPSNHAICIFRDGHPGSPFSPRIMHYAFFEMDTSFHHHVMLREDLPPFITMWCSEKTHGGFIILIRLCDY